MMQDIKEHWKWYCVIILFMVFSPMLYYLVAPNSWLFEPHYYHAENLTDGDRIQTISVNRSTKVSFKGIWLDELLLIDEDRNLVKRLTGISGETYYSRGENHLGEYDINLTEYDLEPGKYYWRFSIKAEMPYNIKRTFGFRSNCFWITD
jgi:hypothetical protein